MTRIITTHYRYKPPPRKRKAVRLAGPAVVASHSRKPKAEPAAAAAPPPANDDRKPVAAKKPAIVPARKPSKLRGEPVSVSEDRAAAASSAIVTTPGRKRAAADAPHLPMELPLSRKPVEREGGDYKALKAAMADRLRKAVTAPRTPPQRHWSSNGGELPTAQEALNEPLAAFPSWFLRITCDRCGGDRMLNEAHMLAGDMTIREIIKRVCHDGCRVCHDGCGGRAARVELLTGRDVLSRRVRNRYNLQPPGG
jgi:hypothetical protein